MEATTKQRIEGGECLFVIIQKRKKNRDRTNEIRFANKIGKPVYLLIEAEADDPYQQFDIRKRFHTLIVTPPLVEMVCQDIKIDVDFMKKCGGR